MSNTNAQGAVWAVDTASPTPIDDRVLYVTGVIWQGDINAQGVKTTATSPGDLAVLTDSHGNMLWSNEAQGPYWGSASPVFTKNAGSPVTQVGADNRLKVTGLIVPILTSGVLLIYYQLQ